MAVCKAISKRTGKRCQRPSIPGAAVCHQHGGGAPQVKKAAALRLAALVDPAIGVVGRAMKDYKRDPGIALRAAFGSLDRNGYGPHSKHEVVGKDGKALIDFQAIDALIHGKPDIDN